MPGMFFKQIVHQLSSNPLRLTLNPDPYPQQIEPLYSFVIKPFVFVFAQLINAIADDAFCVALARHENFVICALPELFHYEFTIVLATVFEGFFVY